MKGLVISLILIIGIGISTNFVFAQEYPERIAGSIEEYYELRGDAYKKHHNFYMAFLSYDKSGNEGSKDHFYNQYQIDAKKIQELENEINNSDFNFNDYEVMINKSYEAKDFERVIQYSDELAEHMPDIWVAYQNKHRVLSFMGKHAEALETHEKLVSHSDTHPASQSFVLGKASILFAMEDYTEVRKVIDEAYQYRDTSLDEIILRPSGSKSIMGSPWFFGILYEKLGDSVGAKIWYEELSAYDRASIDCSEIGQLSSSGAHDKAVRLAESNNLIDGCIDSYKMGYIISKDVVTGQYHPEFDYTPLESSTSIFELDIFEPETETPVIQEPEPEPVVMEMPEPIVEPEKNDDDFFSGIEKFFESLFSWIK